MFSTVCKEPDTLYGEVGSVNVRAVAAVAKAQRNNVAEECILRVYDASRYCDIMSGVLFIYLHNRNTVCVECGLSNEVFA